MNNETNIKCSCGANNKITCSNCSELKMVMLLKHGNDDLKISNGNRKYNPVWYNHLSKNRKNFNVLVNAMFRRFKDSKYANVTNVVNFYNNATGKLVTSIRL